MSENYLTIVQTEETIFFSYEGERLCQWVTITVASRADQTVKAGASIEAGGEEVVTLLEIVPGVREYRCYAPTLWPAGSPVDAAPVRLTAGEDVVTSTVSVGHHRPWTIYLLSDVCTDYTWVSLPLELDTLTMASDLEVHIQARSDPATECLTISQWNPAAQSYTHYTTVPIPMGDFAIRPGRPYRVEVSTDALWPYTGKGLRSFQRTLHTQ